MVHKPSIGRYTKLEEPRARESLLTPTLRRTMSKASLAESSTTTLGTAGTTSTLTVDTTLDETKGLPPAPPAPLPNVPESASLSSMPMIHAMNAAAALMERTPFAIDDAKDDDDEDEDELGLSDNDDQVMDEVSFFFPVCHLDLKDLIFFFFFQRLMHS